MLCGTILNKMRAVVDCPGMACGPISSESVAIGPCPAVGPGGRRIRKGAPWLKTVLVQRAWAASRTKATYLHAQFVRIRARRGTRKAIIAFAASILTAAYHMLKNGVPYRDLGPQHFDSRNKQAQAKRLLARLRTLGFTADFDTLKPSRTP